ncbi:MAG TPA: DUF2203 domain-containing protein [Terriglobia bacterium]
MPEETFDLGQAERLLPQVERLLRVAMEVKQQVAGQAQEQARQIERIVMLGGSQVDVTRYSRVNRSKEESVARLRQALEEIENLGCLVKDLDMGLIDFPCRLGEREFYLCWKLGEPNIQFWHNTDEGFAGRKPIDEKLIQQLQRSCAH